MLEPAAAWSSGWSSRVRPSAALEEHVGHPPGGPSAQSDGDVMRILIVDDEEDIRVLLRNQLERAGYEVAGEAADGRTALELCDRDKPDAVILDLLMPIVNGFETIPKLRSKHPKIGIVAYTAVAGDFVRQEMQRMGIPLVLKSGQFSRLDTALQDIARED